MATTSGFLVGESAAMRDVVFRLERVAPTNATVLITGETGTGKELLARAIHERSRRHLSPMTSVNLAALPDTLIASELFGHEQGAFTGAAQRRLGRFEQADKGTLFLDEVGELTPDMQVALLRVLQEREVGRLGSTQTRRVDVRVIAATNRDLEQAVDDGRFREDLYYRLTVFSIALPPLRDRPEDIPLLAEHFLRDAARRIERRFDGVERGSLEKLSAYSWPGNIRQLQNVIEHSAILSDGPLLSVPERLLVTRAAPASELRSRLAGTEQELIEHALAQSAGRVSGHTGAAARLGLAPSTLDSKIRRFNIDKFKYRATAACCS